MKPLQLNDDAFWKQRFRVPKLGMTYIAPMNPERGLVLSNQSGKMQLYRWHPDSGELAQLTNRPDGVGWHVFDPAGDYVYYLEDEKGNELGHFVRLPYAGGDPEDIMPDLPAFSPAGLAFSRSGNAFGFTAGTPNGFTCYFQPFAGDGTPAGRRELYHSGPLIFGPHLNYHGDVAVIASSEKTNRPDFALLAFDTATGEKIGELWDGEGNSITPLMFAPRPGDDRLLAMSNQTGVEQLLLWNPRTGERTDLVFPELTGSAGAFDWSPDGRQLLVREINQAVQQLYVYNLETEELTQLNHPSGTVYSAYFTPAGEIFVHLQNATHPTRLLALDGQSGKEKRVVLSIGESLPARSWESVHFTSRDGQQIQAWLARPEGDGPFPTILHMIGGPTSVQMEVYSPQCQAWLDHGFAWLSLNYRGCSTFGRDFETIIFGDLGHWEVEDMAAAQKWLVESGIARPDQILLNGWSYGGYLTLMGLSKYPDLWAGGMAGIAITDWAVQYEDSAELLRGFQRGLLGGTPEEAAEQYAKSSPVTYAEQVQAPVYIIQGRNDTRTPARPVEQYAAKMKALGKDITVHWYDTGHAGSGMDIELGIDHQERFLRFAYRILKGR